MVVQTFQMPAVPFKTDLLRGMMPGRQVVVKGNICPVDKTDVVVFSFSAGIHIMDDVLFNMTFDYFYNTIYLNSYLNNIWGEAETIHEMPFLAGNPFEIEVDSNIDEFVVTVKGKEFCSYQHREDPKEITMFEVDGDVELTVVEVWDDLALQTRIPDTLPACPLLLKPTKSR